MQAAATGMQLSTYLTYLAPQKTKQTSRATCRAIGGSKDDSFACSVVLATTHHMAEPHPLGTTTVQALVGEKLEEGGQGQSV
jgi:hypothetical protein